MIRQLITYIRGHRKALVGAVASSAGIALTEFAAGTQLDGRTILGPLVGFVVGGGVVHFAPNEPVAGSDS